jgi:hypothetical protein
MQGIIVVQGSIAMELFIGGAIGVAMVVFVVLAGIVFMKDRIAPIEPNDHTPSTHEDSDASQAGRHTE